MTASLQSDDIVARMNNDEIVASLLQVAMLVMRGTCSDPMPGRRRQKILSRTTPQNKRYCATSSSSSQAVFLKGEEVIEEVFTAGARKVWRFRLPFSS